MPYIPTTLPESAKIKALIWKSGYSQADFARKIGRPPRTVYALLNDKPVQRVSVALIRQVARGLKVKPSEISDWTGDDEPEALASLHAKNGPAAENDGANSGIRPATNSNTRRDTNQ